MRTLGLVGLVITTVAGGVGLLFTLVPKMKPCIGETSAAFTGAPVFPGAQLREHLARAGGRSADGTTSPSDPRGAEVRFSYRASTMRGQRLRVTWSLVAIERDGTFGAVVPGQDRALAMEVVPEACSESGGHDLFVPIPDSGTRYRVVLELYRGDDFTNRLAFFVTEPFRG